MSALTVLCLLSLFLATVLGHGASEDKDKDKDKDTATEDLVSKCEAFWSKCDGHTYSYVPEAKSWGEAELYCREKGGNLVSMHDMDEFNFVQNFIKLHDPKQSLTWIGLTDIHVEGKWMWSDGSKYEFSQWAGNQPDNYLKKEHCGHAHHNQVWNDVPCSNEYPSVCMSRKHD